MPDVSLSLLDDPEAHDLRDAASVFDLGPTVVLAPHPDDESLACGGLLAALARAGVPATVVVVTDGCQSHPNSGAYPGPKLRTLREVEAQRAVRLLGHGARIEFMRFPDCGLPEPGTEAFEAAADRLAGLVYDLRPQTLLVPWRRDPHCDHEATWALAWARRRPTVRWIEYPVWAWTDPEAAPHDSEATAWRLDVSDHLDRKAKAIAAHRSQMTDLIADDPEGFRLAPEVLELFHRPWELFLDPHDVA